MNTTELPTHLLPDTDLAKRYLETKTIPGRFLVCSITGAHHYGFPSPNSDLDIKGIHLAPTKTILGFSSPKESIDKIEIFDDVECDLTSNEAQKALGLLINGNGNMLERILSPYQLVDTVELSELQQLARNAFSKKFYRHYRGFAAGMQNEALKAELKKAKPMLYIYRVLLSGIHLLRAGELVVNLSQNCVEYGYPDVLELIAHKQQTTEATSISKNEFQHHQSRWEELNDKLNSTYQESSLPETPANTGEIEAWLIALRIKELLAN